MPEKNANSMPQPETGEEEALRKRLLQRSAVAAVIVAGLLVALIAFESSVRHDEAPTKKMVQQEIAPTPIERPAEDKLADATDAKPAEGEAAKPEEPAAEPAPPLATKDAEPEPELSEAPQLPPRRERALTVPAQTQRATLRAGEAPAPRNNVAPEKKTAHAEPTQAAQPNPASRPVSSAFDGMHRYLVQAGMFNNLSNAEEVRAKIESAGLPVRIEARVQVGPFASREEAERARENLRWLGLDAGMVFTARK